MELMKTMRYLSVLMALGVSGGAKGGNTDPAEIDFEKFASEAKNFDECREKYKDQNISLVGVFPLGSRGISFYSEPRVFLADGVHLNFAKELESSLKKLQEGDTIRFKAQIAKSKKVVEVSEVSLVESIKDKKAIDATVDRLVGDFKKDPVKFAEKYKHQKIRLRGDVSDVHISTNNGSKEVRLTLTSNYEYIYCELSGDGQKDLSKCKKGRHVTVEGVHRGDADYSINLYGCSLK
jgi:hypothetical protein